MRTLFIVSIFCMLVFQGKAQKYISGMVLDSAKKVVLANVRVENAEMRKGTTTLEDGTFSILARNGDHLVFSMVGYKNRVITIDERTKLPLAISLPIKAYELKPVIVNQGMTDYQKDSMRRAELYQDVIQYEQQKSVMSPVSTVYQKFSRKHKDLRKLQQQIVSTEEQKFIDTRYTSSLVQNLTNIEKDSISSFMNQYPMEYDYARAASELEIKMWIKYNYQDYVKRTKKPKVK